MYILGIETSCDETAAAIVSDGIHVVSNVVASQIPFHEKYGGVVPEIASRKHVENILPVIHECLTTAQLRWEDITAIAVTSHPGLIGSLVIGLAAAKTLALTFKLPLVSINHIEAHMYANCLTGLNYETSHLALVVSGGHTLLIDNHGGGDYRIIGRTVDDAVGEAFDKVAKLLGLGYPGGPIIERISRNGNPDSVALPLPMRYSGDLNFSYSGLKTAVRTRVQADRSISIENLTASFQKAAIEILLIKSAQALNQLNYKVIALSGGVAANSLLRERLIATFQTQELNVWIPPLMYCTDNAAMVAGLGYQKFIRGLCADWTLSAAS